MGNQRVDLNTKIWTIAVVGSILTGGMALIELSENEESLITHMNEEVLEKNNDKKESQSTPEDKFEQQTDTAIEEEVTDEQLINEPLDSEIIETELNYSSNYIDTFKTKGSYNITINNGKSFIKYDNLTDFENIYADVYNYNHLYNTLNIDLGNIGSVENITLNIVDENNNTATNTYDLSKLTNGIYQIEFNYKKENSNIEKVTRIELLIDSNPLIKQENREGYIEVISASFSYRVGDN